MPKRALTIAAGRIASAHAGALTTALIRRFVSRYGVDLAEAANPDPASYASFNDFFTRPLRDGARPLAEADLMPGPDAWRTLAGLRAVADDAAGRDAALEKCKAVAPKAARCALDPGLGGS